MTRIFAAAAILALLAAPLAQAQTPPQSGVSVEHAWARATAPGGVAGAAFATLLAQGAADRLTGASTPLAATVELHHTVNDNGIMRMRPLPDGIALPPGQEVTLAPGGLHVMLLGLKQPLRPGEVFALTLTFAHAPPVTVQVPVQAAGAAAEHHGMDMPPHHHE